MPRPITFSATIGSLAPGGDGVAHVEVDGERRAVFVPHTAPGDVVCVEADLTRRPARGRLLELVTRSADRVVPACAWSTRCGGCDWMHLSAEAQARAHADHVRAALPERWRHLAVEVHRAPEGLAQRTRARVHVRCERGRLSVGMHEARTHDPVEVDICAVLDPTLERARRRLAWLLEGSRGRGDVQLALGVDRLPVLEVRWTGELAPACFARLEQAAAARELAGARVLLGDASRPAIIGDPTPWTTGGDGRPLRLAPGGFGQASERVNAALVQHVGTLVRDLGVDKAVELYAGAGNLGVVLAPAVRELVLVEANRESCEAARANLAARGLGSPAVRVVETDAQVYAWPGATELVVLDPPRAGARAVAERLVASRIAHVIYVSCDPQTLGRDLGILAGRYEARSLATFEMFPQTSHVETVVALERRCGGGREREARTR